MRGARHVVAGLCLLSACGPEPMDHPWRPARVSIIDGQPAPDVWATVLVEHRDRTDVCSGALLAARLVITTQHCVFRWSEDDALPLASDGFRVSFGPDEARPQYREVDAVDWIGTPDALDLTAAVDMGHDVALLHLSEPAPVQAVPYAPHFDYWPATNDAVTLLGFGVSSLATGASGSRLSGHAEVVAFRPSTGVAQLSGDGACHGDSGGPVLLEPEAAFVGVISEVGGSAEEHFCDVGTSFAVTLANPQVRAWLRAACDVQPGGCGPRSVSPDAGTPDAGMADVDAATPDAPGMADSGADAGAVDDATGGTMGDDTLASIPISSEGCGCRIAPTAATARGGLLPLIAVLAWLAVRRRT